MKSPARRLGMGPEGLAPGVEPVEGQDIPVLCLRHEERPTTKVTRAITIGYQRP